MLVENQKVEVKWNAHNVKWYVGKGYTYTKTGDLFMCKVEDLMPTCKVLVQVTCDYCGEIFKTNYGGYQKGLQKITKSCCNKKECKVQKIADIKNDKYVDSYNEYLNFCNQYNYIPLTSFEDYTGVKSFVEFKCQKHGDQKMLASSIIYGNSICHDCILEKISEERRISVEDLISIANKKNCDILNPNDYVNCKISNLVFKNKQCGHTYITSLSNFKRAKYGCPQCSNKAIGNAIRLSYDYVKNYVESKNNNKLLSEVYEKSHSKLEILCGSCNNIFYSSFSNYCRKYYDGKCPNCSSNSVGETIIAEILNNYNVEYYRGFKFDDCHDKNSLPFDFYLPTYNKCIEFDGIHHYEPIKRTSSMTEQDAIKNLEWVQKHDNIKNEFCKNNNIELLRIPYWEIDNLEKILIEELKLTFKRPKMKYIFHKIS